MLQYEVTFIVDPVLSGDEIKETAQVYENLLKDEGAEIVHTEPMGLKQLAYSIKNRTSGIYYSIEFKPEKGSTISKMELALRRDERILRFLTVKLDKYGVQYNQDKRDGKIGTVKKKKDKKSSDQSNKSKPSQKSVKKDTTPKATQKAAEVAEEKPENATKDA